MPERLKICHLVLSMLNAIGGEQIYDSMIELFKMYETMAIGKSFASRNMLSDVAHVYSPDALEPRLQGAEA